jgi:hypothetical protein
MFMILNISPTRLIQINTKNDVYVIFKLINNEVEISGTNVINRLNPIIANKALYIKSTKTE